MFIDIKKYMRRLSPIERTGVEEIEKEIHSGGDRLPDRIRFYRLLFGIRRKKLFESWADIASFLKDLQSRNSSQGARFSEKTCTGWGLDHLNLEEETRESRKKKRIYLDKWGLSSSKLGNSVDPILHPDTSNNMPIQAKFIWARTWPNLLRNIRRPGAPAGRISYEQYMYQRSNNLAKEYSIEMEETHHYPDIDPFENWTRKPGWLFYKEDVEADPVLQLLDEANTRADSSTPSLYSVPPYFFSNSHSSGASGIDDHQSDWYFEEGLRRGLFYKSTPTSFPTKACWRSFGDFDSKRIDQLFDVVDDSTLREFCKKRAQTGSAYADRLNDYFLKGSTGVFTSRLTRRANHFDSFFSNVYSSSHSGRKIQSSTADWFRSLLSSILRGHRAAGRSRSLGDTTFYESVRRIMRIVSQRFGLAGFKPAPYTDKSRYGFFGWFSENMGASLFNSIREALLAVSGRTGLPRWFQQFDVYEHFYNLKTSRPSTFRYRHFLSSIIEGVFGFDRYTLIRQFIYELDLRLANEISPHPFFNSQYLTKLVGIWPTEVLHINFFETNFTMEFCKSILGTIWSKIDFCIVNLFWRMPDNVNFLLDSYVWLCELPGRMANIGSGWYVIAIFFLVLHFFKAHFTEKYGDVIESFFRQCFGQQMFTLTEATLFVNFILLFWSFKVLLNNWSFLGVKSFTGSVTPITNGEGVAAWEYFDSYFFVDGLSVLFVFLTVLIVPLCVLVSSGIRFKLELLLKCLIAVELLLILAFSTSNFFIFYLAFEAVLIPMYFIIGLWGSRSERTRASYLFFIYTLAGSIFFLTALALINIYIGSFNFWVILENLPSVPWSVRVLLWICLFCGFAFKVPLYPVHSWLTVAHVEAPTAGSIILASLLLKLGGYGLCRFVVALLPDVTLFFQSEVLTVCLVGFVYATVAAYRQLDLKRFVAYTSIAHMHFIILSLFTLTDVGYWGSVHSMISHGFISSGLFLMVGSLYDRFGVRNTAYYSGLADQMPLFSVFWTIFLFANAGIPFYSGFPGEFCGFIATFTMNPVFGFLLSVGFICGVIYSVLNISRVIHGSPTIWLSRRSAVDLLDYEFGILVFLAAWVFILGIWPELVVNLLRSTCLF